MSYITIGIDIASRNPGYAVLEDFSVIDFATCHITPKDGVTDASDTTIGIYQTDFINSLIEATKSRYGKVDAIAIESPAYGFHSSGMVSIGAIHGAVTTFVHRKGIPWVYVPPTKWKFALLGKGKHTKDEHLSFVKHNFEFPSNPKFKDFDHNCADAVCLAFFAQVYYCLLNNKSIDFGDKELEKRIMQSFLDKKDGLMNHKNSRIFNF